MLLQQNIQEKLENQKRIRYRKMFHVKHFKKYASILSKRML